MSNIVLRKLELKDIPFAIEIWNRVVEDGNAFPQINKLTEQSAESFFAGQTYVGVADHCGEVVGLYVLHPNNIGRCGHIANASFAVKMNMRGKHIGEKLVIDCLAQAKRVGFKILQFNAVVKSNIGAIYLYRKLGFVEAGEIAKGYRNRFGEYENILIFYKNL